MNYADIKRQSVNEKEYGCFFAINEEQFNKECHNLGLNPDEVVDHNGIYATNEGYADLMDAYGKKYELIRRFCTPQEVYDYEYSNLECDWEEDDMGAISTVVSVFGKEIANTVRRKNAVIKI